jgi:hypothetical protein
MFARAVFFVLAAFWLIMNVLLWRTEFGSHPDAASAIPPGLVWRKILNSPDSSSLAILRGGTRMGYCHWVTSVGEEWANIGDTTIPEGAPSPIRSSTLRLEGSVIIPEWTNRIRFDGLLRVETNHDWRELDLRLNLHPVMWQVHASAPRQTLTLTLDDGSTRRQQIWNFSELGNPMLLLNPFTQFGAQDWLAEAEVLNDITRFSAPSLNPEWSAWEDTLPVNHLQTHVYRLEATLLNQYRVTLLISRVGEILRVELPGQFSLVNDQLGSP